MTPSGNVGVGTAAPGQKLSVAGVVESTTGGFKFPDGSVVSSATQIIAAAGQSVHVSQSAAGAGTLTLATLPSAIRGDTTSTSGFTSGLLGTSASANGFGAAGENLADSGNAIGVFGVSGQSTTGTGVWGEAEASTGDAVGVYGRSFSTQGTGVFGQAVSSAGDAVGVYGRSDSTTGVGVWGNGTPASGSTYGVYGTISSNSSAASAGVFDSKSATANILLARVGGDPSNGVAGTNVFRVDGNGKGFFNGGTQTGGADFAESVDVLGERNSYEPGDVMMIDSSGTRRLALSSEAYSTKVAGIYSTMPGVLATPRLMDDPSLLRQVPLAVVGIVPCKVSAENGAIEPGDLLVASATKGYAMKGTDRSRMLGAVIGKAMQGLATGSGLIQVLVSLQ